MRYHRSRKLRLVRAECPAASVRALELWQPAPESAGAPDFLLQAVRRGLDVPARAPRPALTAARLSPDSFAEAGFRGLLAVPLAASPAAGCTPAGGRA